MNESGVTSAKNEWWTTPISNPAEPPISKPLTTKELKAIDTHVEDTIKKLKTQDDIVNIWQYNIKRDGKSYRISHKETQETYIMSETDTLARLKEHIRTTEIAQNEMQKALQAIVDNLPNTFKTNAKVGSSEYIIQKNNWHIEVIDKSTWKVLPSAEADNIVQSVWMQKLQKGTNQFFAKYGDWSIAEFMQKIDPKMVNIQFDAWKQWNSHRMGIVKYPSNIVHWLATKWTNLTVKSVFAPIRTVNAFTDVFTKSTGPVNGLGNLLKALAFRDVNVGIGDGIWNSLILRALPIAWWTLFFSWVNGRMGSDWKAGAYGNDVENSALATYYGGLFWGLLFDKFMTKTSPLTWSLWITTWAQVPPPQKSAPSTKSVSRWDVTSSLPDSGQQVSDEE